MRKKFKILYPKDHADENKRGKEYKPPPNHMIVMNDKGIFFQYCGDKYYPGIQKLSEILHKYDVIWKEI